jgi:hypothetical protein
MKRIVIIVIVCVSLAGTANAQFAVIDPANLAQNIVNTAKQIVEATQTLRNTASTFNETSKLFEQGKKYYDALKDVHNLVKDAKKVQQTVLLVGEISEIYVTNYQLMMIDQNYTEREITAIGNGYAILLREGTDMLDEVREIISLSSGLSMTDAERMEIIDRVYNRVKKHRNLIAYYTRKNISMSYLRAKTAEDRNRVMELYGTATERYW